MSCDIFVIFYLHRYHIYLSSQQWTRCKVIRNITLTLWQSRAVTRVVVIKNSGIKTVRSDFYWQQLGCVPVMRSEEGWCKMRVMSLCPESHSLSLSANTCSGPPRAHTSRDTLSPSVIILSSSVTTLLLRDTSSFVRHEGWYWEEKFKSRTTCLIHLFTPEPIF